MTTTETTETTKTTEPTEFVKVILVSSDNVKYELSSEHANKSKLVKEALIDKDDDEDEVLITIPTITGKTLENICKFMEYNDALPEIAKPLKSIVFSELGIPAWYVTFIESMTDEDVMELVVAANYMHIDDLLQLCSAKIATRIKGKTPEQIRKEFNLPEEEEAVAGTAEAAVAEDAKKVEAVS